LGDPLVVIVDRAAVERGDTGSALRVLSRLLDSPETIRLYRENVDIAFHGYDHDRRELFEIPEVRNFVAALDAAFPYWLYFFTRQSAGLQAVAACFLPPYLKPEAQHKRWSQGLGELIEHRWGPALIQLGEVVGLREEEATRMLTEGARYLMEGPSSGIPLRDYLTHAVFARPLPAIRSFCPRMFE
jgi:hypothetical protein